MAERFERRATATTDADRCVRATVEARLADTAPCRDAAVRTSSTRFDGWVRENHALTARKTPNCAYQFSDHNLKDIALTHPRTRNFARLQRGSVGHVEVETWPSPPYAGKPEPAFA